MKVSDAVSRPMMRYHGGKWLLAPWIIGQMPAHRVYVEPFGGAASVLLRKPRSYAEVYNDMDGEVVNLFRVVRESGEQLRLVLENTPFARAEFLEAWEPSGDALEQARRTIIRSFMGFASASVTKMRAPASKARGGLATTGFRGTSKRAGTTPAHDWMRLVDALPATVARLRGVVIEMQDASKVLAMHDEVEALHYVDPPYVGSTRDAGGDYRFELTDGDHEVLAMLLRGLKGMVMLSGYRCELYDRLYGDWNRVEKRVMADGQRPRTECLWFNAAAWARRPQSQMFEMEQVG